MLYWKKEPGAHGSRQNENYAGGLIQTLRRFTTVGFIIGSLYSFTCVSRSKRWI